jgi:hypothetical protein
MSVWRSSSEGRRSGRPGEPTHAPIPAAVGARGLPNTCDACTAVASHSPDAQRHAEATGRPMAIVERRVIEGIELWLCVRAGECIQRAQVMGVWMS